MMKMMKIKMKMKMINYGVGGVNHNFLKSNLAAEVNISPKILKMLIKYGSRGVYFSRKIYLMLIKMYSFIQQVTVSDIENGSLRSTLTIGKVKSESSGNYSCQPSMVSIYKISLININITIANRNCRYH